MDKKMIVKPGNLGVGVSKTRCRHMTFAVCLFGLAFGAFAEPVDLAGDDLVVNVPSELASDGYTNSSSTLATLTLVVDEDCVLPPVSGNLRLEKRGTATLVFANKQSYSGGTVVSDGFIGISAACDVDGIGTSQAPDGILLAGGGLSFEKRTTAGYVISRGLRVQPEAVGTIRNAANGAVIDLCVHAVDFRDATLCLESDCGPGLAGYNVSRFPDYNKSWASTGLAEGGVISVGRGAVLFATDGDCFGGANHQSDITLRVCAGGQVDVGQAHAPLTPNVVLENGAIVSSDSGDVSRGNAGAAKIEDVVRTDSWKSMDFCRRVTVCRSESSEPACLRAQNVHLAPLDVDAVFEVQEGAELDVDAQLWPAWNQVGRSLRKVGGGTLRLMRPLAIGGPLYVDEGVVELAPHVMLGDVSAVYVRDGAKLVLGDGSLWNKSPEQAQLGGLLPTAEIWFDATQIAAVDGQPVASVRNLGSSGGFFTKFNGGLLSIPGVPTYVERGIGGKPSLYFAGGSREGDFGQSDTSQALELKSYQNTSDQLTVYLVFKWDGWTENDYRHYMWHGPVSFASWYGSDTEDNNFPGAFDIQYGAGFSEAYFNFGGAGSALPGLDGSPTAENALLFKTERSGTRAVCGTWWSDDFADFRTATVDCSAQPQLNISLVNLGGRYYGYGLADDHRMMKGWIGEMIVFSRTLSDEERSYVESYLKRKWFDSNVPEIEDPTHPKTSCLEVSVSSGVGVMGFAGLPTAQSGKDVELKASGEGTLSFVGAMSGFGDVLVENGTLRLNGESRATSEATLWLDMSDAATIDTDAEGHVVSVRNKGSLGGVFAQCPNTYIDVSCPLPTLTNLNGRAALRFDSNSALGIRCPCADKQGMRRKFVVYGVMRRDHYENVGGKGCWGSAFSFSSTGAGWGVSDNDIDGSFLAMETWGNPDDPSSSQIQMCGNRISGVVRNTIADGTPYLFSAYAVDRDVAFGYETVSGDDQTRMDSSSWHFDLGGAGDSNAPMSYDYLLLGGRLSGQGRAQWWGVDNGANRMWEGSIGEFIVVDRQLAQSRLDELAGYLRKKWFNVGIGSATPPAWLAGAKASSPRAEIRVGAGGVLETSGATMTVGSLTLADGATLKRLDDVDDPAKFALFDVTGVLSVVGSQTLYATTFPRGDVRFVNAESVALSGESTWSRAGAKTGPLNVMKRQGGLWYVRNGSCVIFY